VSDVQLTFNYNPAVLTVTGVTGAGFSLLASSTPGQAVLHYSGPSLPKGTQTPIGYLTATVPGGSTAQPTPYKAKDLLTLSNLMLNGGAIPAVGGNALHVVAYVGDADGSGSYSASDAVLITRTLLNTDTGFTAYPLVDPVIVADTDGAGFIPADAALQANEAGVGLPTANLPIPPIPPGVHFLATAHAVPLASALNHATRQTATTKPINAPADEAALVDYFAQSANENTLGLTDGAKSSPAAGPRQAILRGHRQPCYDIPFHSFSIVVSI
jgi:hypothetical protein